MKKHNKGPKELSKFQALRQDKETHIVFIKHFVKPVVGVVEFNNWIKDMKRPPDALFTRTDEAFALLMLENNWERWIDIFKLSDNRIPPVKRHRDGGEKVSISQVKPLYTEGGISYSDNSSSSSNTKGRGWSEKGRIRFNQIMEMVDKSRKDHPNFLKDFVIGERERIKTNSNQNKKQIEVVKNHVLPKHDKFCDEFENCFNDDRSYSPANDDGEADIDFQEDLNNDDGSTSSGSTTDAGSH